MIATFAIFLALFILETGTLKNPDVRVGTVAYGIESSAGVSVSAAPAPSSVEMIEAGPNCGDAVLDAGEECDWGDTKNGFTGGSKACMTNCVKPKCGDGILHTEIREECEPLYTFIKKKDLITGKEIEEKVPYIPLCGDYCTHPKLDADKKLIEGCTWTRKLCLEDLPALTESMFDDYVKKSQKKSTSSAEREPSSDAPADISSAPPPASSAPAEPISLCGNAAVDTGESCDQGDKNSSFVPNVCRTDCTLPVCGDGVVDTFYGESCDQGKNNSNTTPSACRLSCTPAFCGDGIVDTNEQCDGGLDCLATCKKADQSVTGCGNGVTDPKETCDDGNRDSGDGCSRLCALEGNICGNVILDIGEECDDGNAVNGDGCSTFCLFEKSACGNGVLDIGEECDEGAGNSDADASRCRSTCEKYSCGDGTLDLEEECDDGNKDNRDSCTNFCLLPDCGDGFRQATEQCDDGNKISNDGCSKRCMAEAGHPAATEHERNLLMMVFVITSLIGFTGGMFTGWKFVGIR